MAHPARRLAANVPGDFYVDDTCIDCDTCRWLAPEVFRRAGDQSAVAAQPADAESRRRALEAAVACPTASIGTLSPAPEMPAVRSAFPLLLGEAAAGAGSVYYCGYHSPKSFGAASYLIVRPGGNVLVDSPRFSPTLAARIEALGGARLLFLTHGDDVADHAAWRDRLGCDRVIHRGDVTGALRKAEVILDGGEAADLAPDLRVIPVPGHTEGSCALLFAGEFLFTGDHLAWSARLGHLYAFRDACWHSWADQIRSMERLRGLDFSWVLPGHGRRLRADPPAMRAQLDACLRWMRGTRPDDAD